VNKASAEIANLVGKRLSAVVFVQDYLQLQFDGDMLTVLAWPSIIHGQTELRVGEAGYRDVLCERITTAVTSVEFVPEKLLGIVFSDGATIVVPIDLENHEGPEVVIYTVADGRVWMC